MYTLEYDMKMPLATNWTNVIVPYLLFESIYIYAQASTLPCGDSFHGKLITISLQMISNPSGTPAIIDSTAGKNSALAIEQAGPTS